VSALAGDRSAVESAAPLALVGDGIVAQRGRWSFGGSTPEIFDVHVERSVPGYRTGHAIICELSDFHVSDGARVIDVGCSTGTLICRLAHRHQDVDAVFVGVDSEPEMATVARRRSAGIESVRITEADAAVVDYRGTSFVILYYTLQFVSVHRRAKLLASIAQHMRPGGGIVIFEKTRLSGGDLQDVFNQLYDSFKLHRGFSPEAVIGKQRSLRGVLTPLSSEENMALLTGAGFAEPQLVYKNLAFEGMYARRPVVSARRVRRPEERVCSPA
jgi:tRNA (cmo5U34)-methyltransferase